MTMPELVPRRGWRSTALAEFATDTPNSFVDGPFGSDLKISDLSKDGVPLIRIQHIGEAYFREGFDQFVSEVKFRELSKHDVIPGDLVFAKLGDPVGRSAIIPNSVPRGLIVADCVRLRIDPKKVEPRYLRWAVNAPAVLRQIGAASKGATRQRANLSDFKKLRVPVPDSREEQRQIACRLEQADRLRRTCRYALELTDSFLPAAFIRLFGDYLTRDCPDVFKDVLARPLSNGFFGKNSVYGTGVPVIWVDNLYHTVTINMDNLRRARVTAQQIDAYQVIEGDLLFTRSSLVREGIGQINVVPQLAEPALFECHVIRARVDRATVNPFYVLGLYRSPFGKSQILRRANTATMTTISQSALEQLPCPLPPLPLQNEFAALVERAERLRAVQREALRQAEHLFASLLDRAFRDESAAMLTI